MNEPYTLPKILIVDDRPQNLYALKELLAGLAVEVLQATSGFEALHLTLEHEFCLAIVDVQMPELDGYELVELLRSNAGTASLPVIFVSAIFSDEYHHRKGYDAGAVDFLSKPFTPEILLSKARVFLDLYHQRLELKELVNQLNAKNEALKFEIQQRQQMEVALRQANSDKDKLFAIISHDLRGPFQPLLGNTQLMLLKIKHLSTADLLDMARSIHKSARSIYDLLENLLTWSRLQRDRLECLPGPVDLNKLAEKTVTLLGDMALNKDIRLNHTIEAGLLAYADEYMIETVIRNLTGNALKFTPVGGQVTLSAHRNGLAADRPETGWVEVKVSDTGIGISPASLAKLFRLDVHHTTPGTAQESGTGLGLILCQEMVAKNGGQIWIESEETKGTSVIFTIPALPANLAG
jgi:signal transduction histidine kinase